MARAKGKRSEGKRPDPDALLAQTRQENRGRLKVFLGAAPGVGKTYAMLQNARRLMAEGVDVVIGLVETHGRAETSALLEGLAVLPRRKSDYRGRELEEFDLDAALARSGYSGWSATADALWVVPEPATSALIASGLAVLLLVRQRRR